MNELLLPIFITLISEIGLLNQLQIESSMQSVRNTVTVHKQEEKQKQQQYGEWSKFLVTKNKDYKKKDARAGERLKQPVKNIR